MKSIVRCLVAELSPAVALALLLCGCGTLTGDPGARTPTSIWDDEKIEFNAIQNINASDPQFESSHIVVVSHHGVVLLAGQVENETLSLRAAEIVAAMEHVTSVHNELEVCGATSVGARSNDAWLTAKVKTKLIAHDAIDADRINVTTENGIVYLMGTVPKQQAIYAVEVTQSVDGVRKIVKVFEYID